MREVAIVCAKRSAIGSFGGTLASMNAVDIAVPVVNEVIKGAAITSDMIDEVVIGNVLNAGLGQNIARQIAIKAGLEIETPAFGLSMVCGSGLRAVSLAAQMIKAGDADIILAGGVESMSNAPYVLKNHRFGHKMGNETLVDTMIQDGLWDAFNDYHMGVTAENIAEQYGIIREQQDQFALSSQQKAQKAIEEHKFEAEIVPIEIPQRKGNPLIFSQDEYVRSDATIESLAKLRPSFKKEGSVTAGNASGLNDGAAMLILCEKEKAIELKLPIMGIVKSYATAGVDPSVMGLGVIPAAQKALEKAQLLAAEIDLVEANEAFAAQALACVNELGFDQTKVNVNGGAIALGHPIGASGARILTTLLYEMQKQNVKTGLATLCIGGGMGTALVVERCDLQ